MITPESALAQEARLLCDRIRVLAGEARAIVDAPSVAEKQRQLRDLRRLVASQEECGVAVMPQIINAVGELENEERTWASATEALQVLRSELPSVISTAGPRQALQRSAPSAEDAAPWNGDYYVNVGEGDFRDWDDCREFGFLAAGWGHPYTSALDRLRVGDGVFAFWRNERHPRRRGYVGFGIVTTRSVPASEFVTADGKRLSDCRLVQPGLLTHKGGPGQTEYTVGIRWISTVDKSDARWFTGAFANQNVVCRLRQPETIEFLNTCFEKDHSGDDTASG